MLLFLRNKCYVSLAPILQMLRVKHIWGHKCQCAQVPSSLRHFEIDFSKITHCKIMHSVSDTYCENCLENHGNGKK